MNKAKDLTGKKFNRWTVLGRAGSNHKGLALWLCKCECGVERVVRGSDLRNGSSQSCGCLNIEASKAAATKHGHGHSRLYNVWVGIKQRCYYTNSNSYKYYGGRGITICDEWLHDFQAFHDWAIANGYDEVAERGGCTIDRIDVNGNYEPDNCRWVTMKEQSYNRRNTVA